MMPRREVSQLIVADEGLRRGWRMPLADDGLGPLFHALLEDEELEAVFRDFRASAGPSA